MQIYTTWKILQGQISSAVEDLGFQEQGCQREVIKKRGTTFCGKLDGELPLPLRSFKDPPILSEIISSDLDESQESIFWCKKNRISAVQRKIGIPARSGSQFLEGGMSISFL